MNIACWLARSAQSLPDQAALVLGTQSAMSYRTFAHNAAARAGALRSKFGCVPGDRIAVLAGNCPAYLESLYAIWWAGCVAVPINAKLHPREAMFILEHAGVTVCFASSEWAESLANIAAELRLVAQLVSVESDDFETMKTHVPLPMTSREPSDLAWLFYTSGTTGKPKGAMLTHRNLVAMTFNYFTDVDSIDISDCILHAAPVSHGAGLYNFAHVLRGAKQVFPESGGFDPEEIIALQEVHAGMSMFAAPTMVKRLTEHVVTVDADTANLKTIIYGGGPMYVADLKKSLQVFGNKFVQIYGQGESPMTITALSKFDHLSSTHPRHEARLASVGKAHSGVQVRVCSEAGETVTAGEAGEICVKGDTVMLGYWHDPVATAQSLRDGWLWTGDVGRMDDDGFLTLLDRNKDLIISGGSNIYPREIEEVLLQHPAVAEAAVIGRHDAEWGETVVAFVVLCAEGSLESAELDQLCLQQIARFKRPKEYRFIAALPKNHYGKVLKTELRKLL